MTGATAATVSSARTGVAAVSPARVAADAVTPEVLRVPVRAEPDGSAVTLDVSVYPQSSGRHPVVLLAHGFGGSKDSMTSQATALHERGYVVVTWSARGHGASGGRIHLNDPAYEIADAARRCSISRPPAATSSSTRPGDPRAGVMGGSYGGALGLMLAGVDRRVDGVVSAITWNDLADAFFPQAALAGAPTTAAGRSPVDEPGPFKQVWASTFFLSANGAAAPPRRPVPTLRRRRRPPHRPRLHGGPGRTVGLRDLVRPLRPDHLPALRAGLRDGRRRRRS